MINTAFNNLEESVYISYIKAITIERTNKRSIKQGIKQVYTEYNTNLYKLLDIVLASYKLLGNKEEEYNILLSIRKRDFNNNDIAHITLEEFHRIGNLYKSIDKNIDASLLKHEWESLADFRISILKKKQDRSRINKYLSTLEGRLCPLSIGEYNIFANKIWMKRGSPKFRKRKINGAVWGKPITETNGRSGFEKVIRNRLVGCEIIGSKIILSVKDKPRKREKNDIKIKWGH